MKDLKQKTVRGGLARAASQAVSFALRIGAMAALARMLDPRDFGLVNMVTAVTGVLSILKDAGLSLATVQRATVTDEQLSALFWLNVVFGAALSLVSLALAPALAALYGEPRLVHVTAWLGLGFFINGLGVQHSAILSRQMRFVVSAAIELTALALSSVVGVVMAHAGFGYWALVGMALALPAVSTLGAWWAARWVPGRPRRGAQVGSMIRIGGTVTLNSAVVYVAYNVEKVLLGRFWGADAVGLYGRAYQLVNIPTDNLNGAVGGVALSALSRVQDDPARVRSYFLKGYSLVVALTLPVTVGCALFAEEIVWVVLGPKWGEAAPILRLLTPTVLVFGLINPTFWLLFALGHVGRSLRIALVIAPLVTGAYLVGLPHGPRGVALAYSVALAIWLVPHLAWCIKDTSIRARDLVAALERPVLAGAVAGLLCLVFRAGVGAGLSPAARLFGGAALLGASYALVLLAGQGQRAMYLDMVRALRASPPPDPSAAP